MDKYSIHINTNYTKESLNRYFFNKEITKKKLNELIECFIMDENSFKDINCIETIFFYKDNKIIESVFKFIESNAEYLQFNIFYMLYRHVHFTNCIRLLTCFLNLFDYTLIKYRKHIINKSLITTYQIIHYSKIEDLILEPFDYFDNEKEYRINNKKKYFNTSRNNKIIIDFT